MLSASFHKVVTHDSTCCVHLTQFLYAHSQLSLAGCCRGEERRPRPRIECSGGRRWIVVEPGGESRKSSRWRWGLGRGGRTWAVGTQKVCLGRDG